MKKNLIEKNKLFNEWIDEVHKNEKSKHFVDESWEVLSKYRHLFVDLPHETAYLRAKIVKEATTSEAEKALCDLVLLYLQAYEEKFIIPDWYDKIDEVLKNLKM